VERIMLKSKIHRARITCAKIDYEGSISIDNVLLKKADILPGEQVWVLNMQNKERFVTYAIKAKENSGEIGLNGPAAKLGKIGNEVVILAYANIEEKKVRNFKPKIILVDKKNKIRSIK